MREWKLNNKFYFEGREVRYGFEGSGPALVLVHGTPWSSFNLRNLISGLSNSFTVYLEFRYKDETRNYDVQENSQAA